MNRRNIIIRYILFFLIALGILVQFTNNPTGMMIPLLVFGIVFYLYKNPPGRSGRRKSMFGSFSFFSSFFPKPKQKGKRPSFRVIHGNKKEEDEEPPRYH